MTDNTETTILICADCALTKKLYATQTQWPVEVGTCNTCGTENILVSDTKYFSEKS